MHILIVYNPNAGRGTAIKHACQIEAALVKKKTETKITKFAANGLEVMRNFWKEQSGNPQQFDVAVIIGGDGTLGPNVDAMIKNNVDIPIYAYGRGTANDFASHIKTNCSVNKATDAILRTKIFSVDTLKVTYESDEPTYAINVACGGAFTNGVTKYNKKSKRIFGKFAYLLHACFVALNMKSQLVRFSVKQQEDTTVHFEEDVFLFYILNTPNVGGLRNSAPHSNASDGILDLVCIKKCGLFGKASIKLHQSFGNLHKCKHVTYIQGTDFYVETVGETMPNFSKTDLDGNASEPYPMKVTLGPKVRVVSK